MANENRLFTHTNQGEVFSVDFNDIQDHYCFSWGLDQSTLAPTTPLEGTTSYYGQAATLTWAAPGLHVLDNSRDWRNRILDIHVVHKAAANLLPKGAGPYDPNVSLAEEATLMYTQTGATAANPPVGFYWVTSVPGPQNRRIFAASTTAAGLTAGDLAIWVDPGPATDCHIMVNVIQLPDAS